MKLVLIRHGESQWNLENRFTGWKDVDLSPKGCCIYILFKKSNQDFKLCFRRNG